MVLSNIIQGVFFQKALELNQVTDATGAGDAFWTGFLFAHLQHKNFHEMLEIAQKLAVLKLQSVGHLPDNVNYLEYLGI